ncbi:hypothetical protein HanIR_Chr15g0748571 [Helianthus annuus]|nr:hypothetical protein HanIR_Chr15g0748571 [Helianthus annuus]
MISHQLREPVTSLLFPTKRHTDSIHNISQWKNQMNNQRHMNSYKIYAENSPKSDSEMRMIR